MHIRLSLAAVAASLATAAIAQPASASIWTEIPSGTTQNITAIEYQSASRFWFTTAAGAIFKRQPNGTFAQVRTPGAVSLNDIEFQNGGQIGMAVGNGGLVLRSTNGGDSWTQITGITASAPSSTFATCKTAEALGNLNAVRFAGNDRVWIFGPGNQVVRSQPGVAANVGAQGVSGGWTDANRDTHGTGTPDDDTCRLNPPYAEGFADAFFPSPDVGYLVSGSYSTVFFTSNNLASNGQIPADSAGNGGTANRVIAGDPENPNRMWSVNATPYGRSTTAYTRDGWQTGDWWQIGNDTVREFPNTGPADVDYAGGTVLSAGDSGLVLNSIDGVNFFYNGADGALATQRWNAVGLASGADGAIGGDNGKLAITTTANAIPDLTKPTGTIAGPETAVAGVPVTFSAAVADNAGGSGIDPNGFAWTATGTAGGSGPAVALTFPSSGSYTVRLSFRDLAGNVNEATKVVNVSAATPVDSRPLPTFSLSGKGNGATATISGGKVKIVVKGKIKVPAGVNAKTACSGTVFLTIKKGKKLLSARNAKLSKSCSFAKTISLSKRKVGAAKKLAITVRFQGNSILKPTTKNLKATVKH